MKSAIVLSVLLVLSLNVSTPTEATASTPTGALTGQVSTWAKATVLNDIEIERTAAETKVHLIANGAITNFREVRLRKDVGAERPDRMYLDLGNVSLADPIPIKKVGTALSQVRNGRRAVGVRVVFDSGLDRLFDYKISEQPDGLLVTIREPSAAEAVNDDITQGNESEAAPDTVVAPAVKTIRPEPKAAGDLGLLIVTADTPELAEEWLGSSSEGESDLQILKTAKPDQVINTSFLVTGVTSDSHGDYAVAVSFTLLDPNGKPVLSERRYATTSGHAPAGPAFVMADPMLGIILGESDQPGEYKIIGSVEDLTNNKLARTSLGITLEK